MPRTLTAIILINLLLFVCQTSTQAKESDPGQSTRDNQFFAESEETDIIGYSNILFGSAIRDLDVTRIGPQTRPSFVRAWIVNNASYKIFTIADKTFDVFTVIGSLDNSTVATVVIVLKFPLTMDLDEISQYAGLVRSMYMGKYPQLPVYDTWVWDYDSYHTDWWVGDLTIEDQDDDILWVHWDGYSLMIHYRTAKYGQAALDNVIDRITDQTDKI